jgi:hypothetical protein
MRWLDAARRVTALVLAAGLLAPAPATAAPVLTDTVVAAVDGAPVTASDVALARALGLFGFTPSLPAPIVAADVERLIRATLVVDEAERLDIVIGDAELEAAWQALAERHGGGAALDAWLARSAVEPAWARRMLRDHLRHERFAELRFRAFVFVLEEEVSAALGPGEHPPDARDRARERLRSETAGRGLAEWVEEAARRAQIRRLLPPEAVVPLPWSMPPP